MLPLPYRQKPSFFFLGLLGVILWAQCCLSPVQAETTRKIVLIAGKKSHGPEGNRIHDYPWSIRLLKTLLETSSLRDRVAVDTFFDGWPTAPDALKDAATVMVISDGRDGDNGREAPHLATPQARAAIEEHVARGGGIIVFHFSTFAPDALSDQALDWYGGYFDWETKGERKWYSAVETLETSVRPATTQHPILSGVAPFKMREEFYFNIRFRPEDAQWQPIWNVPALPTRQLHGKTVAWAVERDSGSRGFATTCGHFYDNWKHDAFRKTMLNAIAWTAKIELPENGIETKFVDRRAIQAHLTGQRQISIDEVKSADETVYQDRPYWYKPGHPINPAEASHLQTLPGFTTERILTVPEALGSFTALTADSHGRLLAAAQHRPGIYRITPAATDDPNAATKVEKLGGSARDFGWSHGLLYAFNSLYVTVSEENEAHDTGVYRLMDINGDDEFDEAQQLFTFDAAGEHGPHNIVVHPDQKSLSMICGNGTPLPAGLIRRRPARTQGIDHLMPPGFESSEHTSAGYVFRFNPDGSQPELIASGLRNSFDLAYNQRGELFTFDSDMEWDLGTPWYRPTRICHLVSGAEFGWRGGAAKWPEHYEDSMRPVVNIGPASPTGVVFGYGTKFPEKYQHALFACDWTFATIHAVHLRPVGATYQADVEEFVGGSGLPVTDITIGSDGHLYFAVGGRRLGSAIYRVRYTGTQAQPARSSSVGPTELAHRRSELEAYHGKTVPGSIEKIWPYLGHQDKTIRFAARVALESQPIRDWRSKALGSLTQQAPSMAALVAQLALVRQGNEEDKIKILSEHRPDWTNLSPEEKLIKLRIYELAIGNLDESKLPRGGSISSTLAASFQNETDDLLNRELARLLCRLENLSIVDRLLELMENDHGDRPPLGSGYFTRNPKYGKAVKNMLQSAPMVNRMHFAQMALWTINRWSQHQRKTYFRLIGHAKTHSRGGHQYREHWNRIAEIALDRVPRDERDLYEQLVATTPSPLANGLPIPEGPGREWTLEEALEASSRGLANRDLDHGRQMYSAAGCVLCHSFRGEGSAIGPDLSTLGQRFTLRDILDATLHPSKAISDQYQMMTLELTDGSSRSGRLVSRDSEATLIATELMNPTQTTRIANRLIKKIRPEPLSLMPSGLLNPLNKEELLDLLGYLTQ